MTTDTEFAEMVEGTSDVKEAKDAVVRAAEALVAKWGKPGQGTAIYRLKFEVEKLQDARMTFFRNFGVEPPKT